MFAHPSQFNSVSAFDYQHPSGADVVVVPVLLFEMSMPSNGLTQKHPMVWPIEPRLVAAVPPVDSTCPCPATARSMPKHDSELGLDNQSIGSEDQEAQFTSCQAQAVQAGAAEMLRYFYGGTEAQWLAITNFADWAFTSKMKSRAAQKALEHVSLKGAVGLVSGLHGHVVSASKDLHANHVLQKIIETVPTNNAAFILEEMFGRAHEVACHRLGCRVLCRILEHVSFPDALAEKLLGELLLNIDELCRNAFGNYVVRHILEFGLPEHRHQVASAVLPRVSLLAKHRVYSHVVEACLRFGSPEDQIAIVVALTTSDDELVSIATDKFGWHVMRTMLEIPGTLGQTVNALNRVEAQLSASKFGRQSLQLLHDASICA